MYRSKAKGRNRVESYTRDLTAQASERVALEHELRRAIERNELQLVLPTENQPRRLIALVGAEALIRWRHPTFGDVPPEHFISLAEENGTILQIGDWVLGTGLPTNARVATGPTKASARCRSTSRARSYANPTCCSRIEQLLRDYHLDPGHLQLEITENFIMSQAEEALDGAAPTQTTGRAAGNR